MAAPPIGSRSGDMPIIRDPAMVAALRKTPLATVAIGLDALVGGSAADFVEVSRPNREKESQPPRPSASQPQSTSTALVVRRPTGEVRAIQPFAQELIDVVEPVKTRLLDEAARLDLIRSAALSYVDRPDSAETR